MIKLEIRIDTRELEKRLGDAQKQLRFATARTLTRTAQQAAADLKTAMKSAFDRPTPYTLNAWYAKPARTTDLTASVNTREFASKGRPASKYLAPEIEGGTRGMKGFEKLLAVVSGGQYVIPGRGAVLDGYGNISRGQLVQILSRLSVMIDTTSNLSAKTTARLRKKGLVARGRTSEYFVARAKGTGRPLGIYKLAARGVVVPVLLFVPHPPTYSVKLPFKKIVDGSVGRNVERIADEEIANALATARVK